MKQPGIWVQLQFFAVLVVYVPANRICLPGSYFDVAVDRCESCRVICTYAEIQGTTGECDKYCPDYRDRYPFKATTLQNGFESTTEGHQHEGSKDVLLIPIFIGVGICVCMLVVAAVIIRCRDREAMRQERDIETVRGDLLRHVQDRPRIYHQTKDFRTSSSFL